MLFNQSKGLFCRFFPPLTLTITGVTHNVGLKQQFEPDKPISNLSRKI